MRTSDDPALGASAAHSERQDLVVRAFRLEWFTIAWMSAEAVVGTGAGLVARSVPLVAFGLDSIVELLSAGVLIWRLTVELRRGREFSEAAEERAGKLSGALLFILATYVIVAAAWDFGNRHGSDASLPGLIIAALAMPTMYLLARAKIRVAQGLQSGALRADAMEAITCGWLSLVVLMSAAANFVIPSAWWMNPTLSLLIVWFLVREGREAWAGDDCCD